METNRRWFLTMAVAAAVAGGWGTGGWAEEAASGEEVRVTLNVEGMH